ncbi:DUF6416 domain-containing protein [Streptomyces prasinosporus]|uniref:DUF6416 domain-containing protein n=1 Tax=Streptomyces prasinosporus TaxID=68256 RepID=UPI0031EA7C0B
MCGRSRRIRSTIGIRRCPVRRPARRRRLPSGARQGPASPLANGRCAPGRTRTRAQALAGRLAACFWWEAPEGGAGATYAVRPSAAAVFLAARLGE